MDEVLFPSVYVIVMVWPARIEAVADASVKVCVEIEDGELLRPMLETAPGVIADPPLTANRQLLVLAAVDPARIGSLKITLMLRPFALTSALEIRGNRVSYVELFVTVIGDVNDGKLAASKPEESWMAALRVAVFTIAGAT